MEVKEYLESIDEHCKNFHYNYFKISGKDKRKIIFKEMDYNKFITLNPDSNNQDNMLKYLEIKYPIGDDPLTESSIPVFNDYLNTFHELQKIVHIDSALIGKYISTKEEMVKLLLTKKHKNLNI